MSARLLASAVPRCRHVEKQRTSQVQMSYPIVIEESAATGREI